MGLVKAGLVKAGLNGAGLPGCPNTLACRTVGRLTGVDFEVAAGGVTLNGVGLKLLELETPFKRVDLVWSALKLPKLEPENERADVVGL